MTDEEKRRSLIKFHGSLKKLPPLSSESINELERKTNDVFFYGGVKNEAEMQIRLDALHESMHGNYQKAIELCNAGLKINPNSVYLLHMRGRSYADLGLINECTSDLNKVLTIIPDSAETLYEMANALLHLSMYDEALYYAHKAAEIEPDSYLHCAIDMDGVVAANIGQWDESIKHFDRALEVKPGYEHALLAKARVIGQKGDDLKDVGKYTAVVECHREMLACYEDVLRANPRNFSAAVELGVEMHYLGMHDDAIQHFKVVLELDSEGDYDLANTALSYMRDNPHDEIVKLLDVAIGGNPKGVGNIVCRGILLEMQSRHDDAFGWYSKALKLCSKNVFMLLRISNVLIMLGDGSKATNYLDRVLKIEHSNATAMSMKGTALSIQGKNEEAVRWYDHALDINPRDVVTIHNKGKAMAKMGHHVDAIKQYNRALEEHPHDPRVLHDLGVSLVGLNRLDDALICYKKSLSLRPGYTITMINAGMTLELLKRHDEALACFDSVLETDPNCEAAIYQRRLILDCIDSERSSNGNGDYR